MQDTFFIRDLDTMKVLSDPRRVEILGLLQKPRTTRQVADVLGETANAVHYHILELEKYHLIRVVKTAMKGHLQEKYYQASAHFFTPEASLFEGRFDPYQTNVLQVLQNMQEKALDELHRAAADPQLEEMLLESNYLEQKLLRLSPSQQTELRSRLEALVNEYEVKQPDDGDPALLTVVLFPIGRPQESAG